MSKYDEERKKLLAGMQAGNVSFDVSPPSAQSKYADERATHQSSGTTSGGSKYDEERQSFARPPVTTESLQANADRSDRMMSTVDSSKLRAEVDNDKAVREQALRRLNAKGEQTYQADKADEYQRKYDALPKYRQLAVDFQQSPIGKRFMKTEEANSDFLRGGLNTASLGATEAADRFLSHSPMMDQRSREIIQQGSERAKESTAGKVGEFAGYLLPGTASERIVATAGGAALRNLPRAANWITRGVGAGALEGAAQEAGDVAFRGGTFDPANVAISGAAGGAIGGLGALAKTGIEKGVESLANALRSGQADQVGAIIRSMTTENPTLALPAPRARGNLSTRGTPDVIPVPETGPRVLSAPDMKPPTTARIERNSNPWLQKLENLFATAKQQELPPGREYEYLHDLWSRMAGREDPGLDELIDLASTQRPNKLQPDFMQRARESQRKRDVYGVPLPAKSLSERYNGGMTAPAAMPETQIMHMRIPTDKELANARKGVGATPEAEVAASRAEDIPIISKSVQAFDPEGLKDISGFSAQTRDFYRNMEAALGDNAKPYIEGFNAAKKKNVDMQEYWVGRLKSEVVDKLGIQKGSKISGLVQKFGEKQITLDELKAQTPDWEKVVEGDKWFREAYDNLIDIVNESRAKVYPGNPDKIVPKRSDYYRHFRELNGLEGLKNLFDTPAGIDPSLVGTSDFTKPKTKFASFMQKRGLGPYKNDAVGGFLNYIPAATYATHIDPQISNMRSLSNALKETTGDSKNMNNFIEFLEDFSNDLAGKTNPWDRAVQKAIPGGRKTMAAVTWLSNRVKSNIILGNVASVLAQTANIPSGIAFAKQYAVPGVGRTMKAIFQDSEAMKQSGFLKERFAGKMYRQFDTDWISIRNPLHARKLAEWTMETVDRLGTTFVWNSVHAKGLAEKVADPIAYADNETRKLIAGRGVGEVPIIQKSRLVQLTMPFQLEVANLWRVMGDFVKSKDFGGLATLFVANYVFNRGMEQIRGSGVTFDPIQAMIEAFGEDDLTAQERGGRIAGELFSNLPGGQSIASAFPEYGGNVLGVEVPSRKKLFGDNDPTRFGAGMPLVKGIQQPTTMLLPSFGGNQIRKTLEGVQTIKKEGAYTKGGDLKFDLHETPAKIAQSLLFGPNATSDAREYYKNNRRPLGEKDTAQYQSLKGEDQAKLYEAIMTRRERDKMEGKIDDIRKDENLSTEQKLAKIQEIMVKLTKQAEGG